MPRYKQPQELETGQILGRAHLGIFKDNDDHFHALADAMRTPAPGIYDTDTTLDKYNIWDGWVLVEDDCYTLTYSGVTHTGDVYLYIDEPGNASYLMDSNPSSGTINMLEQGYATTGLRRVTFQVKDDGATGITIPPPYLAHSDPYTPTWVPTWCGRQTFENAPSRAQEFVNLMSNDRWLYLRRPRQAPVKAVVSNYPAGSGAAYTFWNGWFQYYEGYDTVYYHIRCYTDEWVKGAKTDNNWNPGDNEVVLYADTAGGTEIVDCVALATNSGYQDLEGSATLPGTYSNNDMVRLYANLERGDTAHSAWGWVRYVFLGKSSPASDYIDMPLRDVGEQVLGAVSSTDEDLYTFGVNDMSLYNRLVTRRDFAVQTCTNDRNRQEWYRLKRRGNWLLWRGTNVELSWGGKYSIMLGDAVNPYGTVDLVSLKGLHIGMIYALETHGGRLEFAMEY
jgi:hypothetical protein